MKKKEIKTKKNYLNKMIKEKKKENVVSSFIKIILLKVMLEK